MSSLSGHFLIAFAALISPSLGATCQPHAISLPYKSVVISTKAEVRGISWQVGGPTVQTLAVQPSAYYNETYLWGGPTLDSSGGNCEGFISNVAAACSTYRGGLYDRKIPSANRSDVVDLQFNAPDNTRANWTKDDVKLQDNTTLFKYNFALNTRFTNAYVTKAEMGIGRASTLIKTLGDMQKISSRSYSFFWGNDVSSEPRDGSLVFGGYDEALIDGPNVTTQYTLNNEKCKEGLVTKLTSLNLQIGGSTKDVWAGLPDLEVCVIAATPNIMTIPELYWTPIASNLSLKLSLSTKASRNETTDGIFVNTVLLDEASPPYSGNMSLTINNEMTVTIPNNQLFFNERIIGSDGIITEQSKYKTFPIVRIPKDDQMMPRLGGLFFSSAVLIANHDQGKFSIAQAQSKKAPQKIMAFDTANSCIGEVKVAAVNGTAGSGDNNLSSDTNPKVEDKGLTAGGIAGIAVAGVAIVAAIAFILWRRRRRANAVTKPYEVEALQPQQHAPPTEKYGHHVAEVGNHENGVHEMPYQYGNGHNGQNSHHAVELDGTMRAYEAPGSGTAVPNGTANRL